MVFVERGTDVRINSALGRVGLLGFVSSFVAMSPCKAFCLHDLDNFESATDPLAVILVLKGIAHV